MVYPTSHPKSWLVFHSQWLCRHHPQKLWCSLSTSCYDPKKKKMQFSHALHSFIFCVQVYPTITTCLLLIFLQINSSLASTPNYFPFLWFSECLQECKEPHCFREFSVTGSFSCITNTLGDNGWWEEGFMICRASSFQPLNIFLYVHRSYYPWESAY